MRYTTPEKEEANISTFTSAFLEATYALLVVSLAVLGELELHSVFDGRPTRQC